MLRQLSYLLQNMYQPLFQINLRVFHFSSLFICSHAIDTDLLTERQQSELSATKLKLRWAAGSNGDLIIEGGFLEVTSPGRSCNCIHVLRWSSKRRRLSNRRIRDALSHFLAPPRPSWGMLQQKQSYFRKADAKHSQGKVKLQTDIVTRTFILQMIFILLHFTFGNNAVCKNSLRRQIYACIAHSQPLNRWNSTASEGFQGTGKSCQENHPSAGPWCLDQSKHPR